MKEVVAAYPFRIFLKVMNRVVMNDLAQPNGATDSLNQREKFESMYCRA
jgi:predicted transcriptional regulator with HTH domain